MHDTLKDTYLKVYANFPEFSTTPLGELRSLCCEVKAYYNIFSISKIAKAIETTLTENSCQLFDLQNQCGELFEIILTFFEQSL